MTRILAMLLTLLPAALMAAPSEEAQEAAHTVFQNVPEPEIFALLAVSAGVLYLKRKVVRR